MPATTSTFLNVNDIEKAIAFYKALGFKADRVTKADDGRVAYADLSYQGAELGLGNIQMNEDKEFRNWVSSPLGAGVVIYFTVPNVDNVYENAKKLGAVIEYAPTDRSYGRVFGLNDVDGYVVTFLSEKKAARKPAAAKKTAKSVARKPAKKAKSAKAKRR